MEDKEKKPITEKIEDTLDETLYQVQNAVYGERKSIKEDIPATMEEANGFRRINKVETRRNIAKKILKNPKIVLASIGVVVAVIVIIAVIK